MTGFRIEKRSYSRSPWRIVNDQGQEIAVGSHALDHPNLGPMRVPTVGWDTKAAAVEALGDLAADLWAEVYREVRADA